MQNAATNSALALIDRAAHQSQVIVQKAAQEHLVAFKRQMREKVGVEEITLGEPYLPALLVRSELLYLRRMEKLERLLLAAHKSMLFVKDDEEEGGDEEDDDDDEEEELSASDIQSMIDAETNRSNIETKQDLDSARQQAFGLTQYVWHGGDCSECAAKNGETFTWGEGDEPGDVHPNCQCAADPVLDNAINDPPIQPVYPIETLVGLLAGGGITRKLGQEAIGRLVGRGEANKVPKLNDTKTWPKPPKEGKYRDGFPSRAKPRNRGEKSLYDENGGEWRYNPGDKYHNPHWDYKPSGRTQRWQNITIDDLPYLKNR